MKLCISCSKEIRQEKRICGYCGSGQPEVAEQTGTSASVDSAQVQEPKAKKSRKGLFIGLGAAFVAVIAGALAFILLTPNGLEPKDVTSTLIAQPAEGLWAGDSVSLLGTMTLTKVQSDEYRVAVEQFDEAKQSWELVMNQAGFGPAFVVTTPAVLTDGTNKFRLSIYQKAEDRLITSSNVLQVATKVAMLPTSCPVEKFNDAETQFEVYSSPVENGIDCSMAVPNTDYFLPLVYTKVTQEEWETSMRADGGRAVTIGYGETAAYAFTKPATELSTEFEVFVVNFHGIKVYSELLEQGIGLAIEAIPTK